MPILPFHAAALALLLTAGPHTTEARQAQAAPPPQEAAPAPSAAPGPAPTSVAPATVEPLPAATPEADSAPVASGETDEGVPPDRARRAPRLVRPPAAAVPLAPPPAEAPAHTAAPRPAPSPAAVPPVRPAPRTTSASAAPPHARPPAGGTGLLLPVLGGIAALVALAALVRARRRRAPAGPGVAAPVASPEPPAPPPPPPPAPTPDRARLAVELVPERGGLTLISLVFEGELVVRNTGAVAARNVQVEATLLPARSAQDGELGALFARGIARPAVPPFALAPGEERRVRVVTALPLAGLEPLMAGGRGMLVPVVAANVLYAAGDAAEGQTAASWIVGIAREGQTKLAPFWTDAPRMSDRLAVRPHALAVGR